MKAVITTTIKKLFQFNQKVPTINFKKEDLIKLDEIQNRLLFVQDGCQSVGYKTDKDIFLICLEVIQVCTLALVGKAAFNVQVTDPNDDRTKDFAFVMDFLEEYFTQNLNNKLG